MKPCSVLSGAVLALLASCGGDPARAGDAAREWPPGTVLAVDGVPITADEVDRDSVAVVHLALESTERDLRRKALMNLTMPRAIGRILAGSRVADARAAAEAALERARSGDVPPEAFDLAGGYGDVGLALWGAALETPVGAWTPPVEADGAFWLARVDARREHRMAAGTTFDLRCLRFPFLDGVDPAGDIEAAKDELELTLVDPAWRRIVPELTQYRMGVHR